MTSFLSLKRSSSYGAVLAVFVATTASLCPGNDNQGPPPTPEQIAHELCVDQMLPAIAVLQLPNWADSCSREDTFPFDVPIPAGICDQNSVLEKQILKAMSSNRIKVDILKVRACREISRKNPNRTWKGLFEWVKENASRSKNEACATMILGQQETGAECLNENECVGDLVCMQDAKDKTKKTCQQAEVGSCGGGSTPGCKKGESCKDKVCKPILEVLMSSLPDLSGLLADGDDCTKEDCRTCYTCRRSSGKETCQTRGKNLDTCTRAQNCDRTLYCDFGKAICTPRPNAGEFCSSSIPCLADSECQNKKCVKKPAIGENCGSEGGAPCVVGSSCVGNIGEQKCVKTGSIGAVCGDDDDCDPAYGLRPAKEKDIFPPSPLFCSIAEGKDVGTCQLRHKSGEKCSFDEECEVGAKCDAIDKELCVASTAGSACEYNFECDSNDCDDGKCSAEEGSSCNSFNPSAWLIFAALLPILRLRRRE